ncbi:hypothetical protein BKA82DRAFT_4342809 [Pisolithus tinctorius]|nr:hypothetical protein BKA82DRAFT_4342809 [Pisolithus tinctorius]
MFFFRLAVVLALLCIALTSASPNPFPDAGRRGYAGHARNVGHPGHPRHPAHPAHPRNVDSHRAHHKHHGRQVGPRAKCTPQQAQQQNTKRGGAGGCLNTFTVTETTTSTAHYTSTSIVQTTQVVSSTELATETYTATVTVTTTPKVVASTEWITATATATITPDDHVNDLGDQYPDGADNCLLNTDLTATEIVAIRV